MTRGNDRRNVGRNEEKKNAKNVVAIQRTQMGLGMKINAKQLGPLRVDIIQEGKKEGSTFLRIKALEDHDL